MYSLATSLLGDTAPEASEAFGLMEAAGLYDHKALPRLRYGGWVGCGALEGAGLALEHVLSSHGCLPPPWADLPLSLLGSHGSYILCAQQLQAHPSAEAHRVRFCAQFCILYFLLIGILNKVAELNAGIIDNARSCN